MLKLLSRISLKKKRSTFVDNKDIVDLIPLIFVLTLIMETVSLIHIFKYPMVKLKYLIPGVDIGEPIDLGKPIDLGEVWKE